jgi:aminoglycoside phosphotransferase (APT) family kinase protein
MSTPAQAGTPAAEIDVDADLVRALLRDQHPDLAEQPLRLAASGWDNVMFRLGEALAVRMPRRGTGGALIDSEQRWLPVLAPRLPLPVPAPIRLGTPGRGYPWRWSILPWLEGEAADLGEPGPGQGAVLGGFFRALHVAPPADAPINPYRGCPLADRVAAVAERFERVAARTQVLTPAVMGMWQEALAAPVDVAATWLHGDPHARNVLTREGRFSAIIDWGDMAAGDRATDLAAVWMLLPDRSARAAALEAYGAISAATLARARGWAVMFGMMLADIGLHDDARMGVMGARTLSRLEDGP